MADGEGASRSGARRGARVEGRPAILYRQPLADGHGVVESARRCRWHTRQRYARRAGGGAFHSCARHAESGGCPPASLGTLAGFRNDCVGRRRRARGAIASRSQPRVLHGSVSPATSCCGTALLLAVVVWAGGQWWKAAAGDYANHVYKPLGVKAHVEDGSRMVLQLEDPGWLNRPPTICCPITATSCTFT